MKTGRFRGSRDHDQFPLTTTSRSSHNSPGTPPTFRTQCLCFPGPGNIAKSGPHQFPSRLSICSVLIRILVIMTCQILGLGGKEVQHEPIRAWMYPEFFRGFRMGNKLLPLTCEGHQDPGDSIEDLSRLKRFLPGRFRPAWPGNRKNRHVPCFDRSQSPAVIAASRAIIRS